MKLICESELVTCNAVVCILNKYADKFSVDPSAIYSIIREESGYQFIDDPHGLLITKPTPEKGTPEYGGLTYVFGSTSVYLTEADMQRWGSRWEYLLENRIIHELLHHFDKPCHNLDIWLPEHHPILYLLYMLTGHNGESVIGAYCERIFYNSLIKDVNEEEFDETYRISDRTYQGRLK